MFQRWAHVYLLAHPGARKAPSASMLAGRAVLPEMGHGCRCKGKPTAKHSSTNMHACMHAYWDVHVAQERIRAAVWMRMYTPVNAHVYPYVCVCAYKRCGAAPLG